MADATTEETAAVETSDDSNAAATEATAETTDKGEAALGDAGKKALDAMKAKWKQAEAKATAEAEARSALQAKLDGKEAEFTAAQERAATEKAALDKANQRILRSEVKAAAKGVLADPADAYKFLDLDSFEVSDDGDVDADAITSALNALIEKKPYLAAQGGKKFQGSADGGARKDATKPTQLSRTDIQGMSPEAIVQAKAEGRLNDALGIKS